MSAPSSPSLARLVLLLSMSVALLFLSSGCDPAVDVLDPSERYQYSLYGVLDVAADTQAIRIDPLGTSSQVGASTNFDATVVLRNLSSGEEIPLRDSLTAVVTDSIQKYNFWTTHPIQPSTSYQIAVTKDGSNLTTATTTTPAQPPDLTVTQPIYLPCTFPDQFNPNPQPANTLVAFAGNVDAIAAATIHYPVLNPEGEDTLRTWFSRDHYDSVTNEGSQFKLSVFYRPELARIHDIVDPDSEISECLAQSDFFRSSARLVVTAGGPHWPSWQGAPLDRLARPDTFSNVQGGHGFVGGVYTDTLQVPFADRPPGL